LGVLHDYDYEAVAASLATPPRAARVRVSRGLASLRSYLTRMEAFAGEVTSAVTRARRVRLNRRPRYVHDRFSVS
jgi:hypothetical protein